MPFSTIDSPNKHFDTTTYTANGGSQTITNSGSMQPDFFWGKVRSTTSNNILINSIVGVSKYLYSNTTASEVTDANYFTSFNSNGFSVGSNNYSNGTTMVAWQWKANGAGVSNTAGTITSTVSANTTSGFSIVSYTGTGANATVGHGLGVAPKMVIVKSRSNATDWIVGNTNIGWTKLLRLNTTAAQETNNYFNDTAPTSSVFSIGTTVNVNGSGYTYVAYCFADVKGYSKFGSYTGNGALGNGTFTYLGFKPAFVMIKETSGIDGWGMFDNKRVPYNYVNTHVQAQSTSADITNTADAVDFLSNGFKVATGTSSANFINESGASYIYMAFAENPFVSSKGIPTTAR